MGYVRQKILEKSSKDANREEELPSTVKHLQAAVLADSDALGTPELVAPKALARRPRYEGSVHLPTLEWPAVACETLR